MCGLCHALGDSYGLGSRLLTTHDAILLNLLTSAQRETEPETVMRRCPLNPALKVRTNQDEGAAFAAAASVRLAHAAAEDDLLDGNGARIKGRVASALLRGPMTRAVAYLEMLDFDVFDGLTAAQAIAEQRNANAAGPSAAVSAAIFEMTATLAGIAANGPALGAVGEGYGAYIYYADAYRDLEDDLRTGAFNPLRRFVDDVGELREAGRTWLTHQVGMALGQIREGLAALRLYRSRDTLERLLTRPLVELMDEINGTCSMEGACGCRGGAMMSSTVEEKSKRKRKEDRNRELCCCDAYCCGDCCYYTSVESCCCCSDNDNDGSGCDFGDGCCCGEGCCGDGCCCSCD
jgi:hypothetical protein